MEAVATEIVEARPRSQFDRLNSVRSECADFEYEWLQTLSHLPLLSRQITKIKGILW